MTIATKSNGKVKPGNTQITVTICSPWQSSTGNLRALVTINFFGMVIRGIRLLESDRGFWLGMPSKQGKDGYQDICYIPDGDLRSRVLNLIVEAYDQALNGPDPDTQ